MEKVSQLTASPVRERERKERDKSMNQDKTHGQRMKSGGHVAKIRIGSFI
jgi:hypothetical protein